MLNFPFVHIVLSDNESNVFVDNEEVSTVTELIKYTYPVYGEYVLKLGSNKQLPSPYCKVPVIPDFKEFVVHDEIIIPLSIIIKTIIFVFILQIYEKL